MRPYYSDRKNRKQLSIYELYEKLKNLYLLFKEDEYFKEAGIQGGEIPKQIEYKASLSISFQPFPITAWDESDITEDHIFDTIEFLYDHVSKPGEWGDLTPDTGYTYQDYLSYDTEAGQSDLRQAANIFLLNYKGGFELNKEGQILALGSDGLQDILNVKIEPYDEINVDSKVRSAILKWQNRHHDLNERKQAVRDLADVFEWIKKTKKLDKVLNKKDESDLFQIANNFEIRHHNPLQQNDYDKNIWYSWMFHFYLATYHMVIRHLRKEK
jgi:hypothetical protein